MVPALFLLLLRPIPALQGRARVRVQAAMFDNLSQGLERAWDMVRKDGKLTAENIKAPMREIRRALLEADVGPHPTQLSLHSSRLLAGCALVHAS